VLTGDRVRKDPWARAHPVVIEEPKTDNERGRCLDPELFGQGEDQSIMVARYPNLRDARPKKQGLQAPKIAPSTTSSTQGAGRTLEARAAAREGVKPNTRITSRKVAALLSRSLIGALNRQPLIHV
jgi:hypothetical protein